MPHPRPILTDDLFRSAARRRLAKLANGEQDVRVDLRANVSRCEDGAFVEAIVFIPNAAAVAEKES